jgi:hypothetical protein
MAQLPIDDELAQLLARCELLQRQAAVVQAHANELSRRVTDVLRRHAEFHRQLAAARADEKAAER